MTSEIGSSILTGGTPETASALGFNLVRAQGSLNCKQRQTIHFKLLTGIISTTNAMSASKETSSAETNTSKPDEKPTEASAEQEKPAAALEEDDEFEDFPVEGTFNISL